MSDAPQSKLHIQPVFFAEAKAFILEHHRHHLPPQGHLFSIGVNDGEKVAGVVTVGRQVARLLQDGFTAEVTRCATDGTPNACSALYGAAWRACKALGYGNVHLAGRGRHIASRSGVQTHR